jgi:hypothetical protein
MVQTLAPDRSARNSQAQFLWVLAFLLYLTQNVCVQLPVHQRNEFRAAITFIVTCLADDTLSSDGI